MNKHCNNLKFRKLVGGGNFCGIIFTLTLLLFTIGTILPALADGNQPDNTTLISENKSDDAITDTIRTDSIPSADSLKINDELGKGPQL